MKNIKSKIISVRKLLILSIIILIFGFTIKVEKTYATDISFEAVTTSGHVYWNSTVMNTACGNGQGCRFYFIYPDTTSDASPVDYLNSGNFSTALPNYNSYGRNYLDLEEIALSETQTGEYCVGIQFAYLGDNTPYYKACATRTATSTWSSIGTNPEATTTPEYITWFKSPDWNIESSNATSTTNPTFTFKYFYPITGTISDTNAEVCLFTEYFDITINQLIYKNYCEPVTSFNTENTFSTTTSFLNNTTYSYYGSIGFNNNNSYGEIKKTLTNRLVIGTDLNSGITPALWRQDDIITDDNATTTAVKGYSSLVGLYEIITGKFPFNWAFALAIEIRNLTTMSTSTPSFQPATLDMAQIPLTTWERFPNATSTQNYSYTLFSTTTLHQVAQMPWVDLMRTLVSAILWIGFAGVVINKTFGIFNNQT